MLARCRALTHIRPTWGFSWTWMLSKLPDRLATERGRVGEMPCANAHPAYLGLFMDVEALQAAESFGDGEGWASWLVKWPRRGMT